MDFVKATQKISECIETAKSKHHHYVIGKMIDNVENFAKRQKAWDKSIRGALALLYWQNANKYHKHHNV